MNQKLIALRLDLQARFPERRDIIDGCIAAVLAEEHVLLLGPPGTAKSALVRAMAQAFGGSYFERLLTKFSTPEELFGPVSLKGLEADRFERVTTGKLPEAHFGFVDEVFKASSAILNTLLTILNERRFHNGGPPVTVPLVSVFGASNELPEGKEVEALFDRFLFRFEVRYLRRPAHMKAMLTAPEPVTSVSMTLDELRVEQKAAASVAVTDETVDALLAIRDELTAQSIVVSDRRWKKLLKAAKVSAYLAGETKTCAEDLAVLVDGLWREPKERPKIAQIVGAKADPISSQAAEILDAAKETAAKVYALSPTNGGRDKYIQEASRALAQFTDQTKKLGELSAKAGVRARQTIVDASTEIAALHHDIARSISAAMGVRMLGMVK